MNAHELLVITSLEDHRLSTPEKATYRANGWASEVCVPLVAQDRLCGFIDICDSRPRGFAEHADFLWSVAALLAVTLESERLEREAVGYAADLDAVAALAHLAGGPLQKGDVLERLAGEVRKTLGAADCDIFAYHDGRLRCLVSVDERGRDESVSHKPFDPERFPSTARALRAGETVVLRDLDDPRLDEPERDDLIAWGFLSEACIPLKLDGRVVGLVDVFDKRPRDYAEHRGYLAALAPVAAALISAAPQAARGEAGHDTTKPPRAVD